MACLTNKSNDCLVEQVAVLMAQGLTAEAVKALNAYLSEFAADGEAWLQLAKLHIDALNYEVLESNANVASSALGLAGFTGTSGTTTPTGVSLFRIASPLSKTKANVECYEVVRGTVQPVSFAARKIALRIWRATEWCSWGNC